MKRTSNTPFVHEDRARRSISPDEVFETTNKDGETKNQVGCAFGPSGFNASTVNNCVMGSADGPWSHGNIVRLPPRLPTEAYNRGWRFQKWVDGKVVQITIRKGRAPQSRTPCLPPGTSQPASCA